MPQPIVRIAAFLLAGSGLALAMPPGPAVAAASLLVWPIDPVIEARRGAGALWLENQGNTLAVVQIRIFAWNQRGGDDDYGDQTAIVASPPMAQIAPGGRQLVRLTSTQTERAPGEAAFRIVVDEIPVRDPPASGGGETSLSKAGVRFQMRYTIPLFVYGGTSKAPSPGAGASGLHCTLAEQDGRTLVRIRNEAATHVRLVDARFDLASGPVALPGGQLSYILPGSTMHWPLPAGTTGREPLDTLVNGGTARVMLPGCTHE